MIQDADKTRPITRQQEQAELEAVLSSEIFRRAPNLSQILSYVCRQYFSGEAARIKEYNIAVEALGRSLDFDPNEDTIVRVEASRLRKRLRDYYATEGAGHCVQLQLSKAGYVPQFVPVSVDGKGEQDFESGAVCPSPAAGPESSPDRARRVWRRRVLWVTTGGFLLGVLALWAVLASRKPGPTEMKADASVPAPAKSFPPGAADLAADEMRILAGFTRERFIDSLGRAWSADRYFTGGTASEMVGDDIHGVLDPVIYRTARRGDFRYDIPLKPGVYELRLLFAETVYGKGNRVYAGEASRVFHVSINGQRRLSSLDILADAGAPDVPADRVFKDISPAADGFLHLEFTSQNGRAQLNGIEILPGLPGKMRPIRILAGGRSYYDRTGQFWGADRYFIGGRPLTKPTVVQGTSDPELYSNERWGHFSYSIPVPAPGRYKVTLKFAETNFGKSNPGRTGVGSRVFDVFCNGLALLRNFDILKEAGSENMALDRVFRGLVPNAQGKLVLSFVPVKEYPSVRAIEVVDETP